MVPPNIPPFPLVDLQHSESHTREEFLIGYVCLQEHLLEQSTIVESEGTIFGLTQTWSLNLLLVIFSTRYVSGKNFARSTPTFIGHFSSIYVDKQEGDLHPHVVQGVFESSGMGRVVFKWNPLNIFRTPVRHTTLRSKFPGMPMGVEMGVSFSINPAPQGATVAFPFVKNFALSKQQRAKLDVSSANFFPPSFLEDLRDSDFFGVQDPREHGGSYPLLF